VARRTHIDHQEDGELPLLTKPLHVGDAESRRDVPVDRANVVSRHVLSHFGELHPTSAEHTRVVASRETPDQAASRDFQLAYDAYEFRRDHRTGTASRIRSRI
jgi:hypothetical protein